MDKAELNKYVSGQAKKGKKRYFIEKDLIRRDIPEQDIKEALEYASVKKKEFGKKLLIGGVILFVISLMSLFLRKSGGIWSIMGLLSGCFSIYDGYTKIKNYNK